MITIEMTITERIYLPRANIVGGRIRICQGEERIYEGKIEGTEGGVKYVDVPRKQKIFVPNVKDIEDIAVYQGKKLLFKGALK